MKMLVICVFLLFAQCCLQASFSWPLKVGIVWRGFNPFPNEPCFLRFCRTSLLETLWEKEKLLITSNFSFSHSVFYPFVELSNILIKFKIVICKHFQFGGVYNLSFGKGLKTVFYQKITLFPHNPN